MKKYFTTILMILTIVLSNTMAYGHGLCGKCRWQSGCFKCDPIKALRYYLSMEGLITAKEVVLVDGA